MANEIERKFLVISDSYRMRSVEKHTIIQGYLSRNPDATVRVRIRNDKAFLTVKGRNKGIIRNEWEYQIPIEDARTMLYKCAQGTIIEKTRYIVPEKGLKWEIDEFHGAHAGLTIAEIELPEVSSTFDLPDFIGAEVSGDPAYYNSNL